MKIKYVYDEILPSSATDTEQVLNTVAALGRAGVDIELVVPQSRLRAPLTADSLREYYQVSGPFTVGTFESHFDAVRPLQKVAHAVRAAQTATHLLYSRNLPAVAAGLRAGHRVMFEHWRPWPDQYPPLKPLLRWCMTHPRFVGAILHSDYARQSYERLGIPADRLVTVHNGYDPGRMEPRLDRGAARRQLGLQEDAHIAVYAGRVHERKGIHSLLDLAERCPRTTIVIVGSEGHGAIERRGGALPNVRIVPWQRFDRTVVYLYAADVLLLPLTLSPLTDHGTAALPMKLFQYLASGRAVLAPRAPDVAELLNDDNAMLVRPDDPAAAAEALRRLLSDACERERLARAGHATARELTWDARARKILRFADERTRPQTAAAVTASDWSLRGWCAESLRWVARRGAERLGRGR